MNQQTFQSAKVSYQSGDFTQAVLALRASLQPTEINGEVNHLLGNALMRLGRFDEASDAYSEALKDEAYGKVGALACNRGRAFLAASRISEAISSLGMAIADTSYPTPYKAYMALGKAYTQDNNLRDAGVAFRNAAIDESNPEPAKALVCLGRSFMDLGRPLDAIEAYRTALDFATPQGNQNDISSDLGCAYVAANRMSEALDAFRQAQADGTYVLSPEAHAAYQAATKAVDAKKRGNPSSTDAFLAAAGYGEAPTHSEGSTGAYSSQSGSMRFDPLDPMGRSGEMIPSPEDTGFFSIDEDAFVEKGAEEGGYRKPRHIGRIIVISFLVFLLLAVAAGGFAYYKGYGWPTQKSVIESMFKARADGTGINAYLASSVSDEDRMQIESIIPSSGGDVSIRGLDQNMKESTLTARATTKSGGKQDYKVKMVRDGLSWKVSSLEVEFASDSEGTISLTADTASSDTAAPSTAAATSGTSTGSDAAAAAIAAAEKSDNPSTSIAATTPATAAQTKTGL